HLLAIAAREHANHVASTKDGCDRVSAHRGFRAHRSRQRAESPIELGDDGHEDRSDCAQVRLQRFRLADAGGERRVRREHDAPYIHRRDGAIDPRRGLYSAAPEAGLLTDRPGACNPRGCRVSRLLVSASVSATTPTLSLAVAL